MYCKKCGAQIDDDSIFCSKCGAHIAEEYPTVTQNTETENTADEDSNSGCAGCLIAFIIFIIVISMISATLLFLFSQNSSNSNSENGSSGGIAQIIKRDATNNDIEISDSLDIPSLSISLTIHANCDINNLEITLKHYDSNGNLLKTQVEQIGNVVKGSDVTVKIPITDFSLSEVFKIHETRIGVTGGSVSFFQ